MGQPLPVSTPCLASRLLMLLTWVQTCGSTAELQCMNKSLTKRLFSSGLLVCAKDYVRLLWCKSEQKCFAHLLWKRKIRLLPVKGGVVL